MRILLGVCLFVSLAFATKDTIITDDEDIKACLAQVKLENEKKEKTVKKAIQGEWLSDVKWFAQGSSFNKAKVSNDTLYGINWKGQKIFIKVLDLKKEAKNIKDCTWDNFYDGYDSYTLKKNSDECK